MKPIFIPSPISVLVIPELRPERTAKELYQKWHGYKAEEIMREIQRGTKDEMEHTPYKHIARIIASHHLWKNILFYRKTKTGKKYD